MFVLEKNEESHNCPSLPGLAVHPLEHAPQPFFFEVPSVLGSFGV